MIPRLYLAQCFIEWNGSGFHRSQDLIGVFFLDLVKENKRLSRMSDGYNWLFPAVSDTTRWYQRNIQSLLFNALFQALKYRCSANRRTTGGKPDGNPGNIRL